MKKITTTISLFLVSSIIVFNSISAFAATDRFLVEISSNPMQLNEAVDLTITAVDKNGAVDKKFVGDALLNVKWLDETSYKLPNGGIVNFTPSSQWVVKFHKWFSASKIGKITLSAEDILEDTLRGEIQVEVKDANSAGSIKKVTVTSPTPAAIETNKNINIIWNMKDLPNSPLQILIDGKVNTSSSTNVNGEFSVFANDISKGDHTLTVQITNAAGTIIAKSDDINFTVGDLANELFKSINVDPSTSFKEADKITVTLTVAPEVSTVELIILGNSYFMEKVKSGIFEKKLKFNTANDAVQVDAKLTADGNVKTYTNIETLKITKWDAVESTTGTVSTGTNETTTTNQNTNQSNVKITSIKSIYDPVTKKYLINWTVEWTPDRYLVLISSDKSSIQSNPELIQTTTDKQILITPPTNKEYFLQVIGADNQSNPLGEASEILKLLAPDEYKPSAPSCVVDAIKLTDMLIAWKHYLVWNKVAWVDRYTIYQSETPNSDISSMTKMWDTVDNKFEFAFDETATEPAYKYFAVQWTCNNGDLTNIAWSTKVQVGPMNIALYICMIIWFMYGWKVLIRKRD